MEIQTTHQYEVVIDKDELSKIQDALVEFLAAHYDYNGQRDELAERLLIESIEHYFPPNLMDKVIAYKKLLWDNGEDTSTLDSKLTFTRSING
jgi:hypothetical protein